MVTKHLQLSISLIKISLNILIIAPYNSFFGYDSFPSDLNLTLPASTECNTAIFEAVTWVALINIARRKVSENRFLKNCKCCGDNSEIGYCFPMLRADMLFFFLVVHSRFLQNPSHKQSFLIVV